MKPTKYFLSLLAVLLLAISVYAQTADEIIAKHIEAIGGKEKLAGLTSVKFENSIDAAGNGASGSVVVLNGKGYRNESDWGGQKLIQVYTDKNGWVLNPFIGVNEPQAMPDVQYKSGERQIYIVPLLDYAAKGDKVELEGQEKVGNVNAYKIKLTTSNNVVTTYFFDPTTFYMLRSASTIDFNGQPTTLIANFSDYKKTDYGWVIPYTTDIDFGGQFSMTSKITRAEVNSAVDAVVFEINK